MDPAHIANFEQWASLNGISRKVCVQSFEDSGLGLVAVDDIHAGDCILSVPEELFIAYHGVLRDSPIGGLLCEVCHFADAPDVEEYRDVLHEDEVVVVYLMYCFFHAGQPVSSWFQLWPRHVMTTDMIPDNEVENLPSPVQRKMATHRRAVRSKYQAVQRILFGPYSDQFPPDIYTEEHFIWAHALLESRRFVCENQYRPLALRATAMDDIGDDANEGSDGEEDDSEDSDDDCRPPTQNDGHDSMVEDADEGRGVEYETLVPYADFFNHSFTGETNYRYDPGTRRFVVTASRTYRRGEQVYIVYQDKYNNVDLCVYYGFVLPSVAGHDYIVIRDMDFVSNPDTPDDIELRTMKHQLLQFYKIHDHRLRVYPKRIGSLLLVALRIKFLASVQQAKGFRGAPVDLLNEMQTHRCLLQYLLASVLRHRTNGCTQHLDHDEHPSMDFGSKDGKQSPWSHLASRMHRLERDVCVAAINHFSLVLWRLSSTPDERHASQARQFHDWILEYILTCREFGIPVNSQEIS